MGLTWEHCDDDAAWDALVESSPQGNIFCRSALLRALPEEYARYVVCDKGRPVLAAPVALPPGPPWFSPYEPYTTFRFAMYRGPMFAAAVESRPLHHSVPYKLKLMEFMLSRLVKCHDRLSFVVHPGFSDLRAFTWLHFHNAAEGRFDVHLRYSGRVDLQTASAEEYYQSVRQVRRQEAQRAAREGVTCAPEDDVELVNRLEDLVFQRQSQPRSESDRRCRSSIIASALRHGYGRCLAARCPDGRVASAYVFLHDRNTAYYLFAGNHPDLRKSGASSHLMFYALDQYRREGKQWVDMIGLNSPNRGDFKASFNAYPLPHYLVSWVRP